MLVSCANPQPSTLKAIYGEDQRVFADSAPELIKPYLPVIALLTKRRNLTQQTQDTSTFRSHTLGHVLQLCSNDMFYDQLMLGDCSGFAIDEQHLITARHCIADQKSCDDRLFIFDAKANHLNVFPNRNIRTCKRIVKALEREQGDLVLIELNAPIVLSADTRFPNLNNSRSAAEPSGRAFVLGHPFGSILTATPLESPQRAEDAFFSRAKADVSQGSSGSPLIDESTGEIHGVLTGGEYDLVWDSNQGCNQNRTCTSNECQGERFSRAEAVRNLLKQR